MMIVYRYFYIPITQKRKMRLRKVKYFTENYPECIVDFRIWIQVYEILCPFSVLPSWDKKIFAWGIYGTPVMTPQSIPYLAFLKLSSIERHLSCMSPSWTSTQRLFVEDKLARTRIKHF